MRIALALTVTAVLLGGCTTTAAWPDRPEVDFGCDGPGFCSVRGTLRRPMPDAPARGVLELDDGRCLFVDLPRKVRERGDRWWDRRVSVRGPAVLAAGYGPVPNERCAGTLLLYAERLSLKGDR